MFIANGRNRMQMPNRIERLNPFASSKTSVNRTAKAHIIQFRAVERGVAQEILDRNRVAAVNNNVAGQTKNWVFVKMPTKIGSGGSFLRR